MAQQSQTSSRFVYKILTERPPIPLLRTHMPIDAQDGFVHLSTAEQVPKTAGRFFGNQDSIWLMKIRLQSLENGKGTVKWEASRNHGVFAHLYDADIEETDVEDIREVQRTQDQSWESVLSHLEN